MKKRRGLVAFVVVIIFLYVALSSAKSLFLKQIGKRLNQTFELGELRLSYLPPTLLIKEIKSRGTNPFFSAERIEISLPFLSLFKKEKPVVVQIKHPVLNYSYAEAGQVKGLGGKWALNLPVLIEAGYIHEGFFNLNLKDGDYSFQNVSSYFKFQSGELSLLLHSSLASLRPFSSKKSVEGELEAFITRRGREVSINRLRLQGNNIGLRVEGKILTDKSGEVTFKADYNLPTDFIMGVFNLPFDWEGKTTGTAEISNVTGALVVKADYLTSDFKLNRVRMGTVEGQVLVEKDRGGQITASIKNPGRPTEEVIISFSEGKVEGQMAGFHLDPIMNYVSVPWPVSSPAWGNFSLKQGQLSVQAEFRDEVAVKGKNLSTKNNKYRFRGDVQLFLDIPSKDLRIKARSLESSFGKLDVEGQVHIDQIVDLSIKGQFRDIKQARDFTQTILRTKFNFPEIRGAGRALIAVKGKYQNPDLGFDFSCSPAGFERFDVTSARGEVNVERGKVSGKVYVIDRTFQGEIRLDQGSGQLETRISMERGMLEEILPRLGVNFPLRGQASGKFFWREATDGTDFSGNFSGNEIFLLGTRLEKVSGELSYTGNELVLTGLNFTLNGGKVGGRVRLGLEEPTYEFDLRASDVDLSPFSESFGGRAEVSLSGQGKFGQNQPGGQFRVKDFKMFILKAAATSGEYLVNFINNKLIFELKGELYPEESQYQGRIEVSLDKDFIAGEVRGQLNSLEMVLPIKGSKGRLDYLLNFQGPVEQVGLNGAVEIKGQLLPIPGFAHALTDFSALLLVNNTDITIRSFQGKLADGPIQGGGEVIFAEGKLKSADVKLQGRDMQLSVFERTRARADGQIRFYFKEGKPGLEGDFILKEVLWKREFWEKLSFSSSAYYEENRKTWLDDLRLNLRLRASDNVWAENSLGRIRARLDLVISGTVANPIITGEIEAISGTVYFQDRDFNVIRGRLSFFNPLVIDPYLDFLGEAYVKDYHVLFSLSGLVSNLKPEFSSSPALPQEEILSLLALGESYQRRYSFDATQMSTASLISYELAKKPESLLSLDRFRLDPFLMGTTSELTARLTVGKRLSKNFLILYSTNLATQREEIIRLEWELTRGLSLIALRNELGRVSLDFKIRKRF
ncbi:MAG: translocation/assembly module TamB domain-containing protein [Candidatus Aminicenantes bacterium]|nr:translocation/assembly module TamB domain-containing protein [Candidatus Aminicenantes bacterium]